MIDVVIAEDEPMAREQIRLLIGRFPGFQIVGEADDGTEAVVLIRQCRPDVLFTDIRMPGMDGLRLLEEVRRNCPFVETVVISGYSDFSYAKGALQNGCLDYLLKPVNPKQFRAMMERVEDVINTRQWRERNRIFEDIVRGTEIGQERLKKYFPKEKYHISLVRELGLPGAVIRTDGIMIASEVRELNCVYGRDAMEALYVWPEELNSSWLFEHDYARRALGETNADKENEAARADRILYRRQQQRLNGYFTMLSYTDGIRVDEFPKRIREMYEALNRCLILGKTQYLRMERLPAMRNGKREDFDRKQLLGWISRGEWKEVQKELCRVLFLYREQDCPLYKLIAAINHLVADLSRSFGKEPEDYDALYEAYAYSKSMDELASALLEYLQDCFREEAVFAGKIDTEEYFVRVRSYIRGHLGEALSLSELSADFGVSSSYMSRLFKKYAGIPFHEYLTRARIEKAQELFAAKPDYYVKDVAELVGIPDQFYFSRLFRSVSGETPTQYVRECREEMNQMQWPI